jgi:hypothetical protein
MAQMNRPSVVFVIWSPLLVVSAMTAMIAAGADPPSTNRTAEATMGLPDETDSNAPVDYGAARRQAAAEEGQRGQLAIPAAALANQPIPQVTPQPAPRVPGAPITWPLVPIHVILLQDGRVMSYGTGPTGKQGAQLIYDVWDPSQGTDASAHTVLPNSTQTDIFCSARRSCCQAMYSLPAAILTVNGARNSANNQTTIFSPSASTLTSIQR